MVEPIGTQSRGDHYQRSEAQSGGAETAMSYRNPQVTARVAGHPIHPMLVPFPIACFVGALLTDIAYWRTAQMMWADFSAWLLAAGVIMGVLAAIAGLTDFIGGRLIRAHGAAWAHLLGNALVLVLSVINLLVHSRDAWTSVVPTGLILSALVVLILLVTGWLGWDLVYRHRVGVAETAVTKLGVAEDATGL
jgi:uncharacterized membrane protein